MSGFVSQGGADVPDIDAALAEARRMSGAVILDVRETGEFSEAHVPDAVNVPLSSLGDVVRAVPDASTPLYVYCHAGLRAEKAVELLAQMGYDHAVACGGIVDWSGEVVAGA